MVRVKTSAVMNVSTNKLSHSAIDDSLPSPSSSGRKKSAVIPRFSSLGGKCASRQRTMTSSRSSSAPSSLKRNKIVHTTSTPKRRQQSSAQRSRSVSAATRRKTASSAMSKRSRSAPAPRKSTVGRTRVSRKTIVRNIAKAADWRARLSPMAVRVLDSFVNDMLKRLAAELKYLCEQTGQRTVSTDDVRFAIGLLLTGDLLLHALDEGNRAVARYRLDHQ